MIRSGRQSFLGENSEARFRQLQVAVVGLGGGGSHIAQQLAHVGIGSFVLLDPDIIDETNLNRLVGGTEADVLGRVPKTEISSRLIRSVNATAKIYARQINWQQDAERLRSCDVIFGCVDSFVGRSELERAARRCHIPYIDIGMDVHDDGDAHGITGQVSLSLPDRACLHCMGVLRPDLIQREAEQYGAAGARPQVIWPNGVLASTAVGVFMQLVSPWDSRASFIALLEYDGSSHEVTRSTASAFLAEMTCRHFSAIDDLGDPWFKFPPGAKSAPSSRPITVAGGGDE